MRRQDKSKVAIALTRRSLLGAQLEGDALLAHLEGRCARYRWPHHVFFWDSLPKSGYGKIVKKDIRQQLFERGDLRA